MIDDLEQRRKLRELDLLLDGGELRRRFLDAAESGQLERKTTMPHDDHITIRLPAELVARADALVPALEADAEVTTFGRPTRAAVLRLAILKGLPLLEGQYATTRRATKK